jgi:nicotinate-nucleotide--dimethylbenzimidazole phosphoribosyltransferase
MGIGNTGSAALLVHRLTGIPLAACVGRGTGLDDPGLARKLALLTEASARCPGPLGPRETLAEFGGFEIAMMVGAFLAGAEARMILIVDGFIATAALIVAAGIAPAVLDYAVFAHGSAEQGHRRALDHLGATPLLDLGLRLGEGTGVPLAYPLLQAAVNFLNEMASFAEAGVASKSEA